MSHFIMQTTLCTNFLFINKFERYRPYAKINYYLVVLYVNIVLIFYNLHQTFSHWLTFCTKILRNQFSYTSLLTHITLGYLLEGCIWLTFMYVRINILNSLHFSVFMFTAAAAASSKCSCWLIQLSLFASFLKPVFSSYFANAIITHIFLIVLWSLFKFFTIFKIGFLSFNNMVIGYFVFVVISLSPKKYFLYLKLKKW